MKKFLILMLTGLILSGCNQIGSSEQTSELTNSVQKAQALRPTVEASLNAIKMTKDLWKIEVLLTNPEQKEITSARTWLAYNPEILKAIKIDLTESDFDLAAPLEDKINGEKGLIQIGMAKIQDQKVSQAKIKVGEVVFEKIGTGAAIVDFYNYQKDTSGNLNVNMEREGEIYNILKPILNPAAVLN